MSSKRLDKSALLENVVAMLRQYDTSQLGRYELGEEDLTPLHLAALEGRLDVIQKLIESKYPIDEANRHLQRAIHLAIQNGHFDVLKYLVEQGSDINSSGGGPGPIATAIASNRMNALQYLVDKGARTEFDVVDPEGLYEQKVFETFTGKTPPNTFQYNVLKQAYRSHLSSKHKITAVHAAVNYSHLGILKYLLEIVPNAGVSLDKGPFSPLHIAVKAGNLETIKCLADSGPRPLDTEASDKILTPLHVAIMFGHFEVVEFLVQKMKAKTDVTCVRNRYTPLHLAALGDAVEIIKCLVRNGARLSVFDDEGNTPLHLAARISLETVRCLVQSGAPILTTNKKSVTALHLAAAGELNPLTPQDAAQDFVDVVKYLVEHGADINALDRLKFSPLHTAAFHGNLETVKYLAQIGVDIDMHSEGGKGTALHQAVLCSHLPVAEYLLEIGAQTNIQDVDGHTPLHIAVASGDLDCIKSLVQNGANINALQESGLTPLAIAVLRIRPKVVEYLLEIGADANICDVDGSSPLLNALRKKVNTDRSSVTAQEVDEIIELLIRHGADLNAGNKMKMNPLTLAIGVRDLEAVKFLCEKGAALDVPTDQFIPLYVAIESESLEIVKYLIEKGASLEGHASLNGFTPLHLAADCPHDSLANLEIIKYLVEEKGLSIGARARDGITPLHLACKCGNLQAVRYLVASCAPINAGTEKDTPLMRAVAAEAMGVIEYVLDHGADIDRGDPPPIGMAVLVHNLDIVKYLVARGAKINKDDPESPSYIQTLLKMSLFTPMPSGPVKALEFVQYFIEVHGADPGHKHDTGYGLLQIAARYNRWSIVDYLSKGVRFPLHEAARAGQLETVRSLIAAGEIPIDSQQTIEFTPLQLAALGGHFDTAKFLIDSGADIVANNFHASVLHFAVTSKKEAVECTLLVLNALKRKFEYNVEALNKHIDAPDKDGDTPVMWAIEQGDVELTRILLDYGASTEVKNHKGETAMDWAKKEAGNKNGAAIVRLVAGLSEGPEPQEELSAGGQEPSASKSNSPAVRPSVNDLSDSLARVILDDVRNRIDSVQEPGAEAAGTVVEVFANMTNQKDPVTVLRTETDAIGAENNGVPIPPGAGDAPERMKKCKVCCSIV